jgi:hypothetical protein
VKLFNPFAGATKINGSDSRGSCEPAGMDAPKTTAGESL